MTIGIEDWLFWLKLKGGEKVLSRQMLIPE
jgi:hypothetical protein